MTEKRIKITPENRNKNPNQTTKSPPPPPFPKESGPKVSENKEVPK